MDRWCIFGPNNIRIPLQFCQILPTGVWAHQSIVSFLGLQYVNKWKKLLVYSESLLHCRANFCSTFFPNKKGMQVLLVCHVKLNYKTQVVSLEGEELILKRERERGKRGKCKSRGRTLPCKWVHHCEKVESPACMCF